MRCHTFEQRGQRRDGRFDAKRFAGLIHAAVSRDPPGFHQLLEVITAALDLASVKGEY